MTIYIGADHRGFQLKSKLIEWLKEEGHEVVDCGNTKYDPEDDYPDFGKGVAEALLSSVRSSSIANTSGVAGTDSPEVEHNNKEERFGIVICGSGVGMCIAANRFRGIYCGLAFDPTQVAHARKNDHINMISLPSDFVDFEKAKDIVNALLETEVIRKEKYVRRLEKLDT